MLRHKSAAFLTAVILTGFALLPQTSIAGAGEHEFELDLLADGVMSWQRLVLSDNARETLQFKAVAEHCGFVNEIEDSVNLDQDLVRQSFDQYLSFLKSLPEVEPALTEAEYPYLKASLLLMIYAYVEGVEERLHDQLEKDGVDVVEYCQEKRQAAINQNKIAQQVDAADKVSSLEGN